MKPQPRGCSRKEVLWARVMHSPGVLLSCEPVLWQLLALKAKAELQAMELG